VADETVFVDCDNTLILYPYEEAYWAIYGNPYDKVASGEWAGIPDEPEPNVPLIEAIDLYAGPRASFVVWSGGGKWYALRWAEKYMPTRAFGWRAAAKDRAMVGPGDIVVDDQEFKSRGRWMTPAQFVGMVNG